MGRLFTRDERSSHFRREHSPSRRSTALLTTECFVIGPAQQIDTMRDRAACLLVHLRYRFARGDAEFLLSWAPDQELTNEEVERLRDDQTLQLLSAGVDYISFDRLLNGMRVLNNAGAYAEPMSEHVLSLYLVLSKRLLFEHRNM